MNRHLSSLFDTPEFKRLLADDPTSACPAVQIYTDLVRKNEREYLEAIFARLPDNSYKKKLQTDFLGKDANNHLGTWCELMVYDWLDKLGKNIVLQPRVAKRNGIDSMPEFLLYSNGLKIYIEVVAVPESEYETGVERAWSPARTKTFQKMMDSLVNKIGQHPGIETTSAYVICLCLRTRRIDLGEVKTALLGTQYVDVGASPLHPAYRYDDGLVYEKDQSGKTVVKESYKRLSAVLVAKCKEGAVEDRYKLNFGMISNPHANIPIHERDFGEILVV